LWETISGKENLSELNQHLLSALKELPPEYREAIQLAYFRGMTHVEIARQLKRPLGDELFDLISIYALDALPAYEREQVENLLAEDAQAREMLEQYQAVVPVMSFLAAYREPPDDLKSRLVTRVATGDDVYLTSIYHYSSETNSI